MVLPQSIANLGAPKSATPEIMASLRAEKARQAALIEAREHQRLRSLADYVETHPDAIIQANVYVTQFLSSPGHVRLHGELKKWQEILATWSSNQIANLLRDTSEETRSMRETSPFARPVSGKP